MEWIDAATASERLGVKPATLYAYVSRGVLKRRHDGRRSLFDAEEIEQLARRGRPRNQPPELVIESAITSLGLDRPYYRGHDTLTLARTSTFEAVAELLWSPTPESWGPDRPGAWPADRTGSPGDIAVSWASDPDALLAAIAAQRGLPADLLPLDRIQVIVTILGAADSLRHQLDPASVAATGRRLIAGLIDALPTASGGHPRLPDPPAGPNTQSQVPDQLAGPGAHGRAAGQLSGPEARGRVAGQLAAPEAHGRAAGQLAGSGAQGQRADQSARRGHQAGAQARRVAGAEEQAGSVAGRLWGRLTELEPTPELLAALQAALVLLADHELAASTLAARVAASAKADPYAVVLTGLGVLGGPLHGGASYGAERLLAEVSDPGLASRVIGERVRRGERIPGFGHSVYKNGDARGATLLNLIESAAPGHDRIAAARAVLAETRRRRLPEHNIDMALATLAAVAGMIPGAGEAIFAVARTAGWLAHAMEEYTRGTLLRLRATYTGPPPL